MSLSKIFKNWDELDWCQNLISKLTNGINKVDYEKLSNDQKILFEIQQKFLKDLFPNLGENILVYDCIVENIQSIYDMLNPKAKIYGINSKLDGENVSKDETMILSNTLPKRTFFKMITWFYVVNPFVDILDDFFMLLNDHGCLLLIIPICYNDIILDIRNKLVKDFGWNSNDDNIFDVAQTLRVLTKKKFQVKSITVEKSRLFFENKQHLVNWFIENLSKMWFIPSQDAEMFFNKLVDLYVEATLPLTSSEIYLDCSHLDVIAYKNGEFPIISGIENRVELQ